MENPLQLSPQTGDLENQTEFLDTRLDPTAWLNAQFCLRACFELFPMKDFSILGLNSVEFAAVPHAELAVSASMGYSEKQTEERVTKEIPPQYGPLMAYEPGHQMNYQPSRADCNSFCVSLICGNGPTNIPPATSSGRHPSYSDGNSSQFHPSSGRHPINRFVPQAIRGNYIDLGSSEDVISSAFAPDFGYFQFDPPSATHLSHPYGRQALGLNKVTAARNPYNSVVYRQNITQLPVSNTRVGGQPLFNPPRLTETFLSITSQAGLAMLTVRMGNTRLSQNATILFYFAAAFNVFGFLSCLFVILKRDSYPRIPKIVEVTGFICAAYGFLAIMCMLLDDNIMLWVSILAFVASLPALALAVIT